MFSWGRGAMWLLSWSLLPPSGHTEPTASCCWDLALNWSSLTTVSALGFRQEVRLHEAPWSTLHVPHPFLGVLSQPV